MDISSILQTASGVAVVIAVAMMFFGYYAGPPVIKIWVDRILKVIPAGTLLRFASSKVEDVKGEFDAHDSLQVTARLADHFKATITDPDNTSFEDVEEEVFTFLSTELDRYRSAEVKGVPDISDDALRTNVRVVFEQIKRAASEDSA